MIEKMRMEGTCDHCGKRIVANVIVNCDRGEAELFYQDDSDKHPEFVAYFGADWNKNPYILCADGDCLSAYMKEHKWNGDPANL